MRLNNIQISNGKQLRDNFSFKEIWDKINIFVIDMKDVSIISKVKKDRLLNLIKNCIRDLESISDEVNKLDLNFIKESDELLVNKCYIYMMKDNYALQVQEKPDEHFEKSFGTEINLLYNKLYKLNCFSEMKKRNIFCIVLAIHCLANAKITEIDSILKCFCESEHEQGNSTEYKFNIEVEHNLKNDISHLFKKETVELCNSNEPYIIRHYNFTASNNYKIITKKIVNSTNSEYGKVIIHVTSDNDLVLYKIELYPGETAYINTINECFIQKIPQVSVSNVHCIYRGKNTIKRILFWNNTELTYDYNDLNSLTQFCVDDDKGFIGIIDGKIIAYTNIEGFTYIPDAYNYVWISILGTQYIALTEAGDVVSNFMPVKKWKNMISVFFTYDNEAYGIKCDGTVVSTKSNDFTNNLQKIVSITAYEDTLFARNLYNEFFSNKNILHLIEKKQCFVNSYGIIALDENSVVSINDNIIAQDIVEITVGDRYAVLKGKNSKLFIYSFEKCEIIGSFYNDRYK